MNGYANAAPRPRHFLRPLLPLCPNSRFPPCAHLCFQSVAPPWHTRASPSGFLALPHPCVLCWSANGCAQGTHRVACTPSAVCRLAVACLFILSVAFGSSWSFTAINNAHRASQLPLSRPERAFPTSLSSLSFPALPFPPPALTSQGQPPSAPWAP